MLAKADDAYRVLLLRTPPWLRPAADPAAPRTSYVVRDGVVVEGRASSLDKAPVTNWREGNVDPDALARHRSQLRRFQFRGSERMEAPPAGPVWDRGE
jgi:hypothetical protein